MFHFLIAVLFSQAAMAGNIYDYYQDRSDTQWTLGKWLSTKKQTKLMDQWLHSNRKNKKIFDFNLGYGQREITKTINQGSESISDHEGIQLGLYYSFIGIEGEYYRNLDNSEELFWDAALSLRLLGSSQQSTYWNVYYGLRREETLLAEHSNPFYGTRLNLYIVPYLGIYGDYKVLQEDSNDQNVASEGDIAEYGVFLEVFFLRAYYKWTFENIDRTTGSTTDEIENEGREIGLLIYY